MRLYDTLSGEKRPFTPQEGEVKMYVCGPNLYGPCHVGHALSYIVFDTLRRYLEYRGYQVHHVQNFTDIEDRIIEVAQEEGRSIGEVAEPYIQRFLQEMDALGVQRAHQYPRATESIGRMVEIIQVLVNKGCAYAVEGGDVFFRVRSFPSYGRLSRRSLEEMEAGARIEVDPHKDDPLDFVLWKVAKSDEPSWPSPWGPGRPGWHIECTAMSLAYLGETLDIHGGGQDVLFPHHENEIVQSEAFSGKTPFVRFWVHNGLLRLRETDEEKMTRHQGNFVSCREALARYYPDAIRLYLLSSHYRSPLAYSEEGIASMERAMDRVRFALAPGPESSGSALDRTPFRERFLVAMDDDLNTPQALAALFDLAREINRCREEGTPVWQAQEELQELGGILGLTFTPPPLAESAGAQPFIELLVEVRSQMRSARQFALADDIRTRLAELGVALEDGPGGTTWHVQTSRSGSFFVSDGFHD